MGVRYRIFYYDLCESKLMHKDVCGWSADVCISRFKLENRNVEYVNYKMLEG